MLDRYIPEPTIIMFGCQSLDNIPAPKGKCPVCGPGIRPGHDNRNCGKCDSSSPTIEAMIRIARVGAIISERAEAGNKRYREHLTGSARVELSESHRREIWNGHTGRISAEDEPTNRSREGREFLRRIGQVPDWTLVRDEHGRWVCPVAAD